MSTEEEVQTVIKEFNGYEETAIEFLAYQVNNVADRKKHQQWKNMYNYLATEINKRVNRKQYKLIH